MRLATRLRIFVLSAGVILCSVAGNCALSYGVNSQANHANLAAVLINPAVILGILLLIGWMLFRMTLLSITPMSLILPLTAGVAYLLTSAAGQMILHDRVGSEHGWGLSLIVIGVILIGSSASKHRSVRDDRADLNR